MKKLIATLALILSMIVGGAVALATPAQADGCQLGSGCVTPDPPCTQLGGCPPPACTQLGGCTGLGGVNSQAPVVDEQQATSCDPTANDYRAQVSALTAKADRLQRVADRRAATIQRLRAKIRALK